MFGRILLAVAILWGGIADLHARTYYLPDYQKAFIYGGRMETVDSRPDLVRTCETFGLFSAGNRPADEECVLANSPLPGLTCYSCTGCSSNYIYDSSNCSGEYTVSGDVCGNKYTKCICNPEKYPGTSSGSGCPEGQKADMNNACTNKSDNQTVYQCIEDPCYSFMSESTCKISGGYCRLSSTCSGKCESCDSDTCSWTGNLMYPACEDGCDTNGSIEGCPSRCKTGCRTKTCPEGQKLEDDACVNMSCSEAAVAYGYTAVSSATELETAMASSSLPIAMVDNISVDGYVSLSKNIYSPAYLYSQDNQKFIGCRGEQTPILTMDELITTNNITIYPDIQASSNTSSLRNNLIFYGDVKIDWDSTPYNASTKTYEQRNADFYGNLATSGSDFYGRAILNLHGAGKQYNVVSLPYISNVDNGVTLYANYAGCSGEDTTIHLAKGATYRSGCTHTATEDTVITLKTADGDDCGAMPVSISCPEDNDIYSCRGKLTRSCPTCQEFVKSKYGKISSYALVSTEGEFKTAMAAKKTVILLNDIRISNSTVVSGYIYSPQYLLGNNDVNGDICGTDNFEIRADELYINNATIYADVVAENPLTLSGTNYLRGDISFDWVRSSGSNPTTYLYGDVKSDNGGFYDYNGKLYIYGEFPTQNYIDDFGGGTIYVNNPNIVFDDPECRSNCTFILKKGVKMKIYDYTLTATQDNTTIYANDEYVLPASCPADGSYGPKCSGAMESSCGAGVVACLENEYSCGECPIKCSERYKLVSTTSGLLAAKGDGPVYLTQDISYSGSVNLSGALIHSASSVCPDEYNTMATLTIDRLTATDPSVSFYLPTKINKVEANIAGTGFNIDVHGTTCDIGEIIADGTDMTNYLQAFDGATITVDKLTISNEREDDAMDHYYYMTSSNCSLIDIKSATVSYNDLTDSVTFNFAASKNSRIKYSDSLYSYSPVCSLNDTVDGTSEVSHTVSNRPALCGI